MYIISIVSFDESRLKCQYTGIIIFNTVGCRSYNFKFRGKKPIHTRKTI